MRSPLLLFLLTFAFLASAQDAPMYDFGTMQQGTAFTVEPGKELIANLYFYMDEQYGNRIAHITLVAAGVPEGWGVEFDPPLHTATINVSGVLVNISENLYVEPRPVLPQIPEPQEEGIYYLRSPSGLGYLQAKLVKVRIRVPPDATLGRVYDVGVNGRADYYGQTGMVALAQSRNFDYKITVARSGYSESIVTPTPQGSQPGSAAPSATAPPGSQPSPTPAGTAPPQGGTQGSDNTLFLLAIAAAAVIAIAAAYFVGRSRKGAQ